MIREIEHEDEYRAYARAVIADLGAEGALEISLAERVISALWRERRPRRFEAARLSERADEAAAARRDASDFRTASLFVEKALSATYALEGTSARTRISAEPVQEFVAGASLFIDDFRERRDAEEDADFFLGDREIVTGAIRAKVIRRIFQSLGAEYVSNGVPLSSLPSNEKWNLLRTLFRQASAKYLEQATSLDRKAKNVEIDALMPDAQLARTIADAEGRLSRQVSSALADFAAARAMRKSATEESRENAMLPARLQKARSIS